MYCPECGGEYRPSIVECPTCEVALTDLPKVKDEAVEAQGAAVYFVDLQGYTDEQEAKEARRKLRQAGIDAMLQIYEGQSHAQYYRDDTSPEAKEAFEEIAGFFDKHLGK